MSRCRPWYQVARYSRHEPLRILRDPNAAEFKVPELELPAGLTMAELEGRESLLKIVNAQGAAAEEQAAGNSAPGSAEM